MNEDLKAVEATANSAFLRKDSNIQRRYIEARLNLSELNFDTRLNDGIIVVTIL
jgi:hypothetical protein